MRKRVWWGVGAGLVVAAAVVGVVVGQMWPAPKLVHDLSYRAPTPTTIWGGAAFLSRADHFSVIMDGNQCVTRPVTISSIQLYHPTTGIRLVGWGVANGPRIGARGGPQPGGLRLLGGYSTHLMSARCGAAAGPANIGLELRRTGTGPQSFLGLRVIYRSSGRTVVGYFPESFRITR